MADTNTKSTSSEIYPSIIVTDITGPLEAVDCVRCDMHGHKIGAGGHPKSDLIRSPTKAAAWLIHLQRARVVEISFYTIVTDIAGLARRTLSNFHALNTNL